MKKYILKLYIIGETTLSKRAIKNLQQLCALPELEDYSMEVINLAEQPQLAEQEKILATPLLIKELPEPIRRVIGDLSDQEKVLVGLDVRQI